MRNGRKTRWLLGSGFVLCGLLAVFWRGLDWAEEAEVEGLGSPVAVTEAIEIPGERSDGEENGAGQAGAELDLELSPIEERGRVLEEKWMGDLSRGRAKLMRLVEVEDFVFPILVARDVERDAATGRERSFGLAEMAADRVIVRFRGGADASALAEALEGRGLRLGRRLGVGGTFEVFLPQASVEGVAEGLALLRGGDWGDAVLYAEPNYIVHASVFPDDPRLLDGSLWGLNNEGQNGGVADADIDAPEGWDIRTEAAGVIVAVIDTGINYLHSDLAANVWVNDLEIAGNGVDDDGNGWVDDVHGINTIRMDGDPMDDNGHGTHCSGTIGAVGDDGLGVAGVAWAVQLMGAKFLSESGSGTTADAITCIDYAVTMGADVLSNSWGGGGNFSQALYDAIAEAEAQGVAFVAAAGNAASDIDEKVAYPAAYDLGNIVSVASVDRRGELSGFSNYGLQNVDIAAPGSAILSTWIGGASAYETISGTSMATPHVSGALALLIAEYPESGLQDNLNRIFYGASPLPVLEDKIGFGAMLNLASSLGLEEVPRPPRFRDRPVRNAYEREGASLVLAAEVESEYPVTYQWFFDGEAIEGEASNSLELEELSLSQAGIYRFEASNRDGMVRSSTRVAVLRPRQLFAEALDARFLPVYTYGDADWSVYSFDSVVGSTSLRSGLIDDDGESAFFTEVSGPGRVSFFWRVSSEAFGDYGQFLVNGESQALLRSQKDWSEYVLELNEARLYRLEWLYLKDGSVAEGQDALFVDSLVFDAGGEGPPIILEQPEGGILGSGASYTLGAYAVGDNLRYQWTKDGSTIFGETASTLEILADSESKAGDYAVLVSNEYGEARSVVARIRIADISVSIEGQPRDLFLDVGASGVFEATVAGSLPLSLQWYRDGLALAGETQARLTFDSARLEDAGEYFLRVSNAYTIVPITTESVRLAVSDVSLAPKFVKQPQSGYWQTGESFRLSTAVEGTFPFSYQWFKDGLELAGETERFLDRAFALPEDDGVYVLRALNALGEARSEGARVRIVGDVSGALDLAGAKWSIEGNAYFFEQSEETYDGEDALQSSIEDSILGVATLLETELAGPGNFSLYWKQDTELVASNIGIFVDDQLGAVLDRKRDWHRALVWVPEGIHTIRISGRIEAGSTIWLDQARLDSKPMVHGHSGSPALSIGDPLELWADVRGAGVLRYQWYRNGLPVQGVAGSEYRVAEAERLDAGTYRLEVKSEHGLARVPAMQVRVSSDLASEVGDGSLYLELANADSWKGIVRQSGNTVLRSGGTLEEMERKLSGLVVGPGVLVFDLGIRSAGCCASLTLLVDGEEVARYSDTQSSEKETVLSQRAVWIEEGSHLVSWRFDKGLGGLPRSREAYVDNIRITGSPVIVRDPLDVRVVEGEKASLAVSVLGQGTILYQWFKDGQAIEGETAKELVISETSGGDAGTYHCRVTNEAGIVLESRDAELAVVTNFYEALGLYFGKLVVGGAFWNPREGISRADGLALSFDGSSAPSYSVLVFDIDVPAGERRGVAFWIRTEGMGEGARVRVTENSGKRVEFGEDVEWRRVVMPLAKSGVNRLYFTVSKGGGLARDTMEVFLDDFELVEAPLFYAGPKSGSRFWGESFALSAEVTGERPMSYYWTKDGEALALESGVSSAGAGVVFERVSDAVEGDYRLQLENVEGFAESKVARLELVSKAFGEAVGSPGTSVWSEGSPLWKVAETGGAVGTKALSVEGVGALESSELVFWIRGPGIFSMYWKLDTPSGDDRLGLYLNGFQVSGLFASSGWERYELRVDEQFYQVRVRASNVEATGLSGGRAWVDSIRFENDGAKVYEDWVEEVFAGTEVSLEDRGLEADPDGDGVLNFVEYALREDPLSPSAMPELRWLEAGGESRVEVDFPIEAWGDDIAFGLEISRDAETWYPLRSQFLVTLNSQGSYDASLIYAFGDGEAAPGVFVRMAVYFIGENE